MWKLLAAAVAAPALVAADADFDEELAVMMTLRFLQSNATNATNTPAQNVTAPVVPAVTEAPASNVTEAPVTEAPVTEAPAKEEETSAPETKAPETSAPETRKPEEKPSGPPSETVVMKDPKMWAKGLPNAASRYDGCKTHIQQGIFSDSDCTKPTKKGGMAPVQQPSLANTRADGACTLYFLEMTHYEPSMGVVMPMRMSQAMACDINDLEDGADSTIAGCASAETCEEAEEQLAAMLEGGVCSDDDEDEEGGDEEGGDQEGGEPAAEEEAATEAPAEEAATEAPASARKLRSLMKRRLDGHDGGEDEGPACMDTISAMEWNMASEGMCNPEMGPEDEIMFYTLLKVVVGTCGKDSAPPPPPPAATLAVQITMSIEIETDLSEDEFAAMMTSADPSDPVVAALQESLISNFADAMNLPEDAVVTIISITFVDARRLQEEEAAEEEAVEEEAAEEEAAESEESSGGKLGAGKKMVVEYEISGIDESQAEILTESVAESAAEITSNLQSGLNADIESNADLKDAVSPVVVDSEIPEPVMVVDAPAASGGSDDSDSGAGSLKESAGVLFAAAAMSLAMF